MSKLNVSLFKRIDEYRTQKNISWEKLAYSAGIAKSSLSELKDGVREAKFLTVCKIIVALGISHREFFNFDLDLSELE